MRQSERNPSLYVMNSGETVRLADFRGHIEHVHVPSGGIRGCWRGLRLDSEALITSILVLPYNSAGVVTDDLGDIEFRYNGREQFTAPVAALMNRYHGAVTMGLIEERLRMVFNPNANFEAWLADPLPSALPEPIYMRENLMFEVRHHSDHDLPLNSFTVEMQMLVKSNALTTTREMFKWSEP